jgi:hypothetical protein
MSGYNEDAYRQARETAIDLPCPFERALLSLCVACFKSRKLLLAEREAISCSEREANGQCKAFHEALHHNARFALHMDPNQPWPFGKEIRAQCGGVLGLKESLGHGEEILADVAELVMEGITQFQAVDRFPYSEIMRAVVHYEPRKRRGG